MTTNDFYIVNDIDRPEPRLIAQELDGALWYLNPEIRNLFPAMSTRHATRVKDFGIDLAIADGCLVGELVRESTATYPDGKPRRWQGAITFRIPIIPEL